VGAINYYVNLLQISNSVSLWLRISPPDLFFYAVSWCSFVLPSISPATHSDGCNWDTGILCQRGSQLPPSSAAFMQCLPPLLVDSALRIDLFMFRKVGSGCCFAGRHAIFPLPPTANIGHPGFPPLSCLEDLGTRHPPFLCDGCPERNHPHPAHPLCHGFYKPRVDLVCQHVSVFCM
jgi:hypothetical protein